MAQRHIAEMEAARNDKGEDDPKAQHLIETFKNGKKLTAEEMAYIRKNAPGMVDYIDRIMRDREMTELSMKSAPTKMDVQMVAYRAGKQFETYSGEEGEIRAKHLADAKHEYEQTDDYKEKPASPLSNDELPRKKVNVAVQVSKALVKLAYERHDKKTPNMNSEK